MGLLLVVPFALFFLARCSGTGGFRRAVLEALVLFAGFTLVGCELLSLFSLYKFWPVLSFWFCIAVVTGACFRKPIWEGLHKLRAVRWPKLQWQEWACLGVIAVFALGTLATALLYPPTMNYDSTTYHMPRVFFWIKNASVHNYATGVARQLFTGPFAEFCITQFQVLNGGNDIMANSVQWVGYVGAILAVSSIPVFLGVGRRGQIAIALLTATVPLVVLQARTTQTDLFAAFWCVVVVYFVLLFLTNRPQGREFWFWALFTGLAGGGATLTKNTSYVTLAPFALLFLIMLIRKIKLKHLAILSGIIVACVLVFNAGFYARNAIELDGDFLAYKGPEMGHVSVTTKSIPSRISVATMNFLQNFTSESRLGTAIIRRMVDGANKVLGLNPAEMAAETEDQILLHGLEYSAYTPYYNSHDIAPSPLHAGLILVAGILLFFMFLRKKVKSRLLLGYALACLVSLLLMITTIKWSTSTSRYLLGLLLLALPLVAIPFRYGSFRRTLYMFSLVAITLSASRCLLFDLSQPLVNLPSLAADMGAQYNSELTYSNASRHQMRIQSLALQSAEAYDNIYDALIASGARKIGFQQAAGLATYPWLYPWHGEEYDVQYINTQYHAVGEESSFVPDAIILMIHNLDPALVPDYTMEYHGRTYGSAESGKNDYFNMTYLLMLPLA